ncbi:alpha-glucosidase-like [Cryptotermes secundus]|uniref:alpha-glucosidase-like n=1 Tax=Cryptotermes secundus TaxID=105785 RepID=UPI000CD7B331|nr:alpha-glucosidase-like [Cryptotermes secundus]
MDGMIMLALLITYYGKEIAMEDTFISWEQTVDPPGSSTGRHRHLNHSQSPRDFFQWDDTQSAGFSANKGQLSVNTNYKVLKVKNEMKHSKSQHSISKHLVEAEVSRI